MAEKRNTAGRKREVVEMMLSGADRTSLVTERMKKLYERGRNGEKEGQRETASPEEYAADTVQEEMERTSQQSTRVIRTVRRTSEHVQRVKKVREGKSVCLNTGKMLSRKKAKTAQTVSAGERMKTATMKQVGGTAKQVGQTGMVVAKNSSTIMARLKQFAVISVEAVYNGIKSSAALTGVLGVTMMIVILLICTAAMIFGSAFGIFFTEYGNNGGQTLKTVMRELDAEYDQTILGLQNTEGYDILEMHGKPPEWKDVLSVYAVKTNLDSEELITMTKRKERKLRDVYWDMCRISSGMKKEKRTVTATVIDKDGKATEEKVEKEVEVLTIQITGYSAQEMERRYLFSREQSAFLEELVNEENNLFWQRLFSE